MDNKLKIVNYLGKEFDKEPTMYELANILNIPYATFHRTINGMNDLLIIKQIGKSKILKLNLENSVIQSYLAISSDEEKKKFLIKQPILKIIQKELHTTDIVLLFGSYAKGKERKNSDIDLMIINKSGNRSISFSKHELIFRKKINPLFFKKKEYKEMLKEKNENVGKQALRNHIILNNPYDFWQLVINAIQ
jgi:predicted nucleotidyltransferase